MERLMLNFYKGKRVFVTGHTGFKGSWLCKILANAGAQVTGYSLNPPTTPNFFEIAKSYYEIYGSKVIYKNDCFAVFDENENTTDVFYSAYKNINELSALLLENTKSERFVFTGKSDNAFFENCQSQKCGMIKSLDKNHNIPDDVYIGITLS